MRREGAPSSTCRSPFSGKENQTPPSGKAWRWPTLCAVSGEPLRKRHPLLPVQTWIGHKALRGISHNTQIAHGQCAKSHVKVCGQTHTDCTDWAHDLHTIARPMPCLDTSAVYLSLPRPARAASAGGPARRQAGRRRIVCEQADDRASTRALPLQGEMLLPAVLERQDCCPPMAVDMP